MVASRIYRKTDAPWNFYFNGVMLPRWAGSWRETGLGAMITQNPPQSHDWISVGFADVVAKLGRVGEIHSSDSSLFLLVIQEAIIRLATDRARLRRYIKEQIHPEMVHEVYEGLRGGLMRMRELILMDQCALWTTGYKEDREKLSETLRRMRLKPSDPHFLLPPHQQALGSQLQAECGLQMKKLKMILKNGVDDRDLKRDLLALREPQWERVAQSQSGIRPIKSNRDS